MADGPEQRTAGLLVTEILRELAFPLNDRIVRPVAFGGERAQRLRAPLSVIQSEAKDRSPHSGPRTEK